MSNELIVEFSLEPRPKINAEFSIEPRPNMETTYTMRPLERNHATLYNRDIADQHPISAITDLEERLTALENQDKNFVFEQGIATDTWTINHDLEKYPSVTVVDSAGNAQIPDEIEYISQTQIIVKFVSAFAGIAYLN